MKNFRVIIFMIIVLCLSACSNGDKTIISLKEANIPEGKAEKTEVFNLKYQSDGLEVAGYIIKPVEIKKDAPVMIYNRGGNRDYDRLDINTINYLSGWARKGYVVLASQYRGNSSSEGKEEFGGSDVNDVLNLINVANELPYADTDHIVMLGESRGGMMSYLAAKQGIKIKAMAVVGGMTDLFDTYENREDDMKNVLEELVGDPVKDKQKYIDRSAVYWAEDIKIPTLILHGEDDVRVSIDQSRELVKELDEHNKEYKFISYPRGDHMLNTHFEEMTTEIDLWFSKYIKN
ncbi:S9 family peptidase [Bacillus sp. BGMRC 2118]|nr:S9 family peptidase [Bacillus sp. BGMRC 2118]